MTGEYERRPSIEESTLIKLGYSHRLDTPIEPGSPTLGRNFLDAYGDSPRRQDTEDILRDFATTPEADPEYGAKKAYVMRFVEAKFGPPQAS